MPPVKHIFCLSIDTSRLRHASSTVRGCKTGGVSLRSASAPLAAPTSIVKNDLSQNALHHLSRRTTPPATVGAIIIGAVLGVAAFAVFWYFACCSDKFSRTKSRKRRRRRCDCGHKHMSAEEWQNCQNEWNHRRRVHGPHRAIRRGRLRYPYGYRPRGRAAGRHHRGHRHHRRHRRSHTPDNRRRRNQGDVLELQDLMNVMPAAPAPAAPAGGMMVPNEMDAPQDDPVAAEQRYAPRAAHAAGGHGIFDVLLGRPELRHVRDARVREGHGGHRRHRRR